VSFQLLSNCLNVRGFGDYDRSTKKYARFWSVAVMLVDLRYHDRVSAQIHNAVMRGWAFRGRMSSFIQWSTDTYGETGIADGGRRS
jgi:hypothetical protein